MKLMDQTIVIPSWTWTNHIGPTWAYYYCGSLCMLPEKKQGERLATKKYGLCYGFQVGMGSDWVCSYVVTGTHLATAHLNTTWVPST